MRAAAELRAVWCVAAGPRIGFGHLMRVRALARALRVRPIVELRGGAAARRMARAIGFEVLAPGVDALAGTELIVVDDPSPKRVSAWVSRARRRQVPVVTIHDAATWSPRSDLAIDGAICAPHHGASAARLAGPRFYVLDPRIVATPRAVSRRGRGSKIVISLGGGAHVRRAAVELVSAIGRRCPRADIAVVSGLTESHRPALPFGRWVRRVDGITDLLSSCDVAVVGGGVTLYEACAQGTPVVSLAVVGAQRPAIRSLAASGAVIDGGGPVLDRATADRVSRGVARLMADGGLRRRVAGRARRLVDGRGASRVAQRIWTLVRDQRRPK